MDLHRNTAKFSPFYNRIHFSVQSVLQDIQRLEASNHFLVANDKFTKNYSKDNFVLSNEASSLCEKEMNFSR